MNFESQDVGDPEGGDPHALQLIARIPPHLLRQIQTMRPDPTEFCFDATDAMLAGRGMESAEDCKNSQDSEAEYASQKDSQDSEADSVRTLCYDYGDDFARESESEIEPATEPIVAAEVRGSP